jgi:hypothetical protein
MRGGGLYFLGWTGCSVARSWAASMGRRFNPALLNGNQPNKHDHCEAGQNRPQGLPLLVGHGLLILFDLATPARPNVDETEQ